MAVGAEANVIGEVPADVVGIFVDDDLVGIPEPIAAEAEVGRSNAEIEAVEPEAGRAAAGEMPDMAFAEAAGEVAMLPRLIKMVVGIVGARIVADPFAVGVNVRSFGVAGFVGIVGLFGRGLTRRSLHGRGTFFRNIAVADVLGLRSGMLAFFLRESRKRTEQEHCKNCEKRFHACLRDTKSSLVKLEPEIC